MRQDLRLALVEDRGCGLRLDLGFCKRHLRQGFELLGRNSEGEGRKIVVAMSVDVLAAKMFHQRVVSLVLGNDMEVTSGVSQDVTTEVEGQSEIEGVLAARGQPDQLQLRARLGQILDRGHIEFCLLGTSQQREVNRFAANDSEIKFVDVLEIHEDMVYGRWEVVVF